jgi:Uma2 family endonuclease
LFNLGKVYNAPFEMRAVPDGSSREPDLLFVSSEHLDRLTPDRLVGPADLIVEVVSDDSVYRDRVDKFEEYEAAGVREYWIVDPRPGKQRADFWVLDETGRYRAKEIKDGIYHSTMLPGLWLRVEWLLAETSPDPLIALAQIVGADKITEALRAAQSRDL